MKTWSSRKDGKSCPVCRTPIVPAQLQRFAMDQKAQPEAPPKIVNNEPLPKSLRQIEYNFIDPSVMDNIELMESQGSYGSKIQTLVRHLMYIQVIDPGAKSIVFSAWADSLHSALFLLHCFLFVKLSLTVYSHRTCFEAER
jgi:E3 ubiquitin-protein ligase SHPRH